MKKILTAVLFIALINIVGLLFVLPTSPLKKKTIYLALVGPMTGEDKEDGKEMLRGAKLYLDKIKKQGKFKNKKIELLVFDDQNKRTSIKIATRIANENKALLILGHYGSSGSAAAGTIYRKSGIPAVTASATANTVTFENDWYFRVVPGNHSMGAFIADYIKKSMNRTTASIIYDIDEYSSGLKQKFEPKARELGISVKNKFVIDKKVKNPNQELKNIIGRIRAAQDAGIIFCAVLSNDGVELFTSSRYPGTDYPVIGPDSFSTPSFISKFNNYAKERTSPGYYSDGIYTMVPFLPCIAGNKGLDFRIEFVEKYGREPSWISACYYDAALVALTAVERADIQGQDIRKDRRNIRDALARFDSRDVAVNGITGNIYFDEHGNFPGTMYVGVWHKQMLLPAFWQYQHVRNITPSPVKKPEQARGDQQVDKQQAGDQNLSENEIMVNKQILTKVRVVYAGIDVNKIYNLDTDKGTFTADFYLWFRFQGDFDDTGIIFTNAVNSVKRSDLFMKETAEENITIRSYRVIADFKTPFDVSAYPFDRQRILISLCHADQPRTKLIYTPDLSAFQLIDKKKEDIQAFRKKVIAEKLIKPISDWNVTGISFFEDIAEVSGTGKQKISYSQLNAEIRIQRKNRVFLFFRTFFPVIAIIVILFAVYFIPAVQLSIRGLLLALATVMAGGFHFFHMTLMPAYKMIEYTLLSAYMLAGIFAVVSVLTYVRHKLRQTWNVLSITLQNNGKGDCKNKHG
ncbi:MAG: ABC transporter substrate-binding protein [Desulfobacteraceae bacterium]|nr:ABC transporter substrate-binding protein [Desulfobacteraceae bacterium]